MVNMNIMTEEMKKELAFTEEELKELEQFYQFHKPFYQLSKFLNFDTKIRGKKLLPTKGLVNSNADIAQTSINPGLLLKVRKTDGNVTPKWEVPTITYHKLLKSAGSR